MANYSADEKGTQLDVLTTLASDDVIIVADTSDSGKAKAITKANLQVGLNGAQVAATATDTTPGVLDDKVSITSNDSSVTITKTVTNPGANEKIIYDLSASGGGGGGSGGGSLSKLQQTFAFGDFVNVGGNGVATFTGSLPADAVPIGVVYDITAGFDFAGNTIQVKSGSTSGAIIGAPVTSNTIAELVGVTDGNSTKFDFVTSPHPVIYGNSIPTQGSVTVTIVYDTSSATAGISTYISRPVALTAGGTSSPTPVNDNTVMAVGLVNIPQDILVTKLSAYIANLSVSGTFTYVIYSEDGQTQLLTATTATVTVDAVTNTTSTSSTLLPAGNYYVGVHPNGSAAMTLRSIVLDNLSVVPVGGSVLAGFVTIAASTTPATIDPTTDITFNLYAIPLIRFDA